MFRHFSLLRQLLHGSIILALASGASGVELLVPETGSFNRNEPIPFDLDGVPDETALRLKLSLDGVDVTGFVQREGSVAKLVLPYPIESGEHALRLIEVRDDGTIREVGTWTPNIASGPVLEDAEFQASLSGEVHRRFADEDLDAAPQRTLTMGSARVEGWLSGEDWDAQLNLPVLYRRDRQTQSGQPWDVADGWLRARHGRLRAEVGYLTPGPSSLVLEGFHRRGVAAHVDLPELRSQLTTFSLRGEPISGFEEGIGLSDRDRRVNGVIVSGRPVESERGSLALTGTYLRGRTTPLGSGIGSELVGAQSGTAWSLVADGQVGGDRVRLRGEYARSRLDPAVGLPGDAERDDAYSAWMGVRPFGDFALAGSIFDLEINGSLEETGSQFGSPANLFMETDRRREQFGANFRWRGLEGRAHYARTRYNAEGREEDPAFRNDAFEANIRYQMSIAPEGLMARTLGAPFVEAGWNRNRLKPISTPESTGVLDAMFGPFLPTYADEHQRQGTLRIGSVHGLYDWSLSHTIGRIEDRTRLQPDTRSDLSSLYIGWRPSLSTRFSLSVQRDRLKLEDRGAGATTWTATLGADHVLIPDRLDMLTYASLTQLHDTRSFGAPEDGFGLFVSSKTDQRILTFSGALNWTAVQPKRNRPGLTITLDGVWERFEDDVVHSNTRDTFQTFLKFRVDWPLHWRMGA